MQNVGIYTRLSDEDRNKQNAYDESESIQNQKSMLINYSIEKGWQIYKIYCDEDYSGSDRNRPEWNQMIKDCEDGKISIVLCKTQSRFSRDMEMIERYIHGKFIEWGVRFVGVIDNADTEIIGNKKSRQINGLVNEWYLEDLSGNIRRTLDHKKRNGQWTGSFAPYGYSIDPNNKNHLVVDPIASKVVKDIFQMFADGKGYVVITKELNNKGISCPALYKQQNGSNYKTRQQYVSGIWTDSTIYYILRQEVYLGVLVQGKTHSVSYKNKKRVRVPKEDWIRCYNAHDPIIDKTIWDAVQSRLRCKSRTSFAGTNSGKRHLLSGKVFCGVCGNVMYKMSSHAGNNKRYRYLKCKTTKNVSEVCDNHRFMRLDYLEQHVLEQINKLIERYYNPNLIELPEQKESLSRELALKTEQKNVSNEIEVKKKMSSNLYTDKLKGLINEEQFVLYNDGFWKEIEQLKKRLLSIDQELSMLTIASENTNTKDKILSKYKHITKLTHSIVNEFIDVIYIGKVQSDETRKIEIKWNFK